MGAVLNEYINSIFPPPYGAISEPGEVFVCILDPTITKLYEVFADKPVRFINLLVVLYVTVL